MWRNSQGQGQNRPTHRKAVNRGINTSTPTPVRNIILNMEEFARSKLTTMQMLVEGKRSVVLLDSCSSASIITKEFLTNHLNKTEEDLTGPIGSIRGIGDTITRDLGRIRLTLTIWNKLYKEEFIVIDNAGFPGDVLLSAEAMGRCGLCTDFRTRTITSKDTNQKVAF